MSLYGTIPIINRLLDEFVPGNASHGSILTLRGRHNLSVDATKAVARFLLRLGLTELAL